MRSGKKIICFGEILWDGLPTGPTLGGAPFNLACRLSRFGNHVTMISRVGNDDPGHEAIKRAEREGINTTAVQIDAEHQTGMVNVMLDPDGIPTFDIIDPAAYDFIEWMENYPVLLKDTDLVCFGALIQRNQLSARTLEQLLAESGSIPKFLDLNLRAGNFTEKTVASSLHYADLLKLNEMELDYVSRQSGIDSDDPYQTCLHILKRWNLQLCIVTLGERGVFAADGEEHRWYEPGYDISVADTVGAGDACSAGFTHSFLQGKSLAECCRQGNILGALSATLPGAVSHISDVEIEEFETKNIRRKFDPKLKIYYRS